MTLEQYERLLYLIDHVEFTERDYIFLDDWIPNMGKPRTGKYAVDGSYFWNAEELIKWIEKSYET